MFVGHVRASSLKSVYTLSSGGADALSTFHGLVLVPVWDDILTPLNIDPGVNISYDILTPGSIYRNDILTPPHDILTPSQ